MNRFEVTAGFSPAGDQKKAIRELKMSVASGNKFSVLKGITGSGKSATIAWLIEELQRPTLILAPNKALAAQLANELIDDGYLCEESWPQQGSELPQVS